MKSILISIQPKWCELIANGKKTIEVRKNKPKLDTPFKCYIYCTKDEPLYHSGEKFFVKGWDDFGNGKVIGEFVCDDISKYTAEFVEGDYYEDIRYYYDDIDGEEQEMIICTNETERINRCYLFREACMKFDEIKRYVGVNFHDKPFYGWHISNLVIYDRPRELREFTTFCEGTGFTNDKLCVNCCHFCFDNDPINGYTRWCGTNKRKNVTRPPQSWCYVEEQR